MHGYCVVDAKTDEVLFISVYIDECRDFIEDYKYKNPDSHLYIDDFWEN